MRSNSKGFTPILVVLVLALVTTVGYFAYKAYKPIIQPISQPIAFPTPFSGVVSEKDKVIYRSEDNCNYSIEISNSWKKESGGQGGLTFTRFIIGSMSDVSNFIQIECNTNSSELPVPPEKWAPNEGGYNAKYYKYGELNGSKMFQVVWGPNEGANYYKTDILRSQKPNVVVDIYTLIPYGKKGDENKIFELEEYNKLVSSFRFN